MMQIICLTDSDFLHQFRNKRQKLISVDRIWFLCIGENKILLSRTK